MLSKRLENLTTQNEQLIHSLQNQIKQLESQLDFDSLYTLDSYEEIQVIPESYLRDEFPYYCGVSTCKKPFPNYFALYRHASQHSPPMISFPVSTI